MFSYPWRQGYVTSSKGLPFSLTPNFSYFQTRVGCVPYQRNRPDPLRINKYFDIGRTESPETLYESKHSLISFVNGAKGVHEVTVVGLCM